MENSAYNHLNNKGPKRLAFFQTSDVGYSSEYGIYNSTGQLLKGNEFFEQYTELAKQLDTKRSAFYLELKETKIIFGCSLIVKADNGREERVVFIQVNKNLPLRYEIDSNIELLKQFYQEIKVNIENLEFKKYRLIGLWNEGDFLNIKGIPINNKDALEYTLGKILDHEKAYIKISELSNGLSLVLELIVKLKTRSSYVFDVSQYPSESEVSISLIKPNPDFEIERNGTWQEFIEPKLWIHYKKMWEEFTKDETFYSRESQNRQVSLSPFISKILRDPIAYSISSNVIFDSFDDKKNVEIFNDLIQEATDTNDNDIKNVLINIYQKIKASEHRNELHRTLLSKNIYIERLIKDLIITIYEEQNTDLLNLFFINKISPDNSIRDSKYDSFKEGTKNALKNFEYSKKINFVRFITSQAPSKPKTEGKILLNILIEDLVKLKSNDFILKLTEEELDYLDEILDTNHLDTKRRLKKEKRNKKIKKVFYAGLLVTIVLLISYFLLSHIPSKGGEGENNSSSKNIENNSTVDEYSKKSSENENKNNSEKETNSADDQKNKKNKEKNETSKNSS